MLDPAVVELQDRYTHWRRLELGAREAYGTHDDVTQFYRKQRERVEELAQTLETSVAHLDPRADPS